MSVIESTPHSHETSALIRLRAMVVDIRTPCNVNELVVFQAVLLCFSRMCEEFTLFCSTLQLYIRSDTPGGHTPSKGPYTSTKHIAVRCDTSAFLCCRIVSKHLFMTETHVVSCDGTAKSKIDSNLSCCGHAPCSVVLRWRFSDNDTLERFS